jgi:hypothetical protein
VTAALATARNRARAGLGARCEAAQGGGRLTLEERLGQVLETARAQGVAGCPVCGGRLTPAPEGAACRDCGSVLT